MVSQGDSLWQCKATPKNRVVAVMFVVDNNSFFASWHNRLVYLPSCSSTLQVLFWLQTSEAGQLPMGKEGEVKTSNAGGSHATHDQAQLRPPQAGLSQMREANGEWCLLVSAGVRFISTHRGT